MELRPDVQQIANAEMWRNFQEALRAEGYRAGLLDAIGDVCQWCRGVSGPPWTPTHFDCPAIAIHRRLAALDAKEAKA